MSSRKDAVLLSLQIAYEYEGWGPEHISAMLDTYEATGETPPCSYDVLIGLTGIATRMKSEGRSFDETQKLMLSRRR